MKRFFASILILLLLCLTACGKSEEAQAVDDAISELGYIGLDSKEKLEEIEAAYDALSDKEKKAVENYDELTTARETYDEIRHQYDQSEANSVITYINWIGTVNERSLSDIKQAKNAYYALTDSQKELVSNYSELVAADEKYTELVVKPVEDLIKKVGAFEQNGETMPDGFSDALDSANEAYEKLDDEYKSKVANKDVLDSAIRYRSDFLVKRLMIYIDDNFDEINYDTKAKLLAATILYEMIPEADRNRVSNYSKVEKAKEQYAEFEKRPPMQLNSYRMGRNSIGRPELFLNATNVTDQIVKQFTIQVFAYDSEGVPVKVDFSDFTQGCRYSDAVKPGEKTKSSSYWTLYGTYSEMQQVVVILKTVEFFDGSTWSNPDFDTLYNKYNEKLLIAGDPNILARS